MNDLEFEKMAESINAGRFIGFSFDIQLPKKKDALGYCEFYRESVIWIRL